MATSLPRLEQSQKALSEDNFAIEQRAALADVEMAVHELGYDERSLEAATATARSLQHWEHELRRLEDARMRRPEDEALLSQTRNQLTRLNAELQGVREVLDGARLALADLPAKEQELAEAEQVLADLLSDRDALLARKGRLQGDAERRISYLDDIDALEGRRLVLNR